MTKTLKEIYSQEKTVISYEIFPPKNDSDGEKENRLFEELKILKGFGPSLISVTYGAGGSTANQSFELVKRIKPDLKVAPMPHFTCVATGYGNIRAYMNNLEELGIKNILALRGDIPEGNYFSDFQHASDLIEYIKSDHKLSVAAAGYPEGHIDSPTIEEDLKWLKYKVDKGAEVIFTQLFFENEKFFRFLENCRKSGINIPIIPGILPVTSFKQLEKMTSLCRVTIPPKFLEKLAKHSEDKDYTRELGIEFAAIQCEELVKNGVSGIHFYTLNKAYAVSKILKEIQ